MVEPLNHYEIVGVLREVYGVSDHDLAVFSAKDTATVFKLKLPAPPRASFHRKPPTLTRRFAIALKGCRSSPRLSN